MDYIELSVTGLDESDPEIIIAQLGELGFESFAESGDGIQAYIQEELYDEAEILGYLGNLTAKTGVQYSLKKIAQQNWNAQWESAYEPVTISGRCQIRAPFHSPLPEVEFDIIIEPKMSFGTAHHETTSLMIEMLLKEQVSGKRVLDMGCGTGVLAILSSLMMAESVVAIDTDEWAFENSMENVQRNHCPDIRVIRGDATSIPEPAYDLIIANINRNVLLEDISRYAAFLNEDGVLLMSGFYEDDLQVINAAAQEAGLQFVGYRTENKWVGAKYCK